MQLIMRQDILDLQLLDRRWVPYMLQCNCGSAEKNRTCCYTERQQLFRTAALDRSSAAPDVRPKIAAFFC